LDDLDLPNRRIIIAGHAERLGELPHQTLLAWLAQRRITWPKTLDRHVLINAKTALGNGPVSAEYLSSCCRSDLEGCASNGSLDRVIAAGGGHEGRASW
jgi:hypothetical protein